MAPQNYRNGASEKEMRQGRKEWWKGITGMAPRNEKRDECASQETRGMAPWNKKPRLGRKAWRPRTTGMAPRNKKRAKCARNGAKDKRDEPGTQGMEEQGEKIMA